MTNHKKIDAQEVEAYFILKYGSVEKAMLIWLSSEDRDDIPEDDYELMTSYSKLYWPNLNLVRWRD